MLLVVELFDPFPTENHPARLGHGHRPCIWTWISGANERDNAIFPGT